MSGGNKAAYPFVAVRLIQVAAWITVLRPGVVVRQPVAVAKQLVTQAALLITGFVDTAVLQFGYDEIRNILKTFRRYRARDIEAVDTHVGNPGLKFISDIGGVSHQCGVAAA